LTDAITSSPYTTSRRLIFLVLATQRQHLPDWRRRKSIRRPSSIGYRGANLKDGRGTGPVHATRRATSASPELSAGLTSIRLIFKITPLSRFEGF
jgi:hypothetical protein